jgi:hypothetical protein
MKDFTVCTPTRWLRKRVEMASAHFHGLFVDDLLLHTSHHDAVDGGHIKAVPVGFQVGFVRGFKNPDRLYISKIR